MFSRRTALWSQLRIGRRSYEEWSSQPNWRAALAARLAEWRRRISSLTQNSHAWHAAQRTGDILTRGNMSCFSHALWSWIHWGRALQHNLSKYISNSCVVEPAFLYIRSCARRIYGTNEVQHGPQLCSKWHVHTAARSSSSRVHLVYSPLAYISSKFKNESFSSPVWRLRNKGCTEHTRLMEWTVLLPRDNIFLEILKLKYRQNRASRLLQNNTLFPTPGVAYPPATVRRACYLRLKILLLVLGLHIYLFA